MCELAPAGVTARRAPELTAHPSGKFSQQRDPNVRKSTELSTLGSASKETEEAGGSF